MSDDEAEPSGYDNQRDLRTIVPFLAAAAAILLVVVFIVVANLTSPAEDNVTDVDLIGTAAQSLAAAKRDDNEDRIKSATCAGFAIDSSPIANGGEINKIENVQVDGDKATADVTVSVDGNETASAWQFTRVNGHWVVCS
ncbi:hypothetical protein [Aldersonia kunmingensis]|uniref:Rv0361 family membrane protein n=1 Tax=Aldersonia kunmingensis TaxID=408066 RepID=UPI000A93680D|nr:hypothetical protein [Aldersonia kunmingensis]